MSSKNAKVIVGLADKEASEIAQSLTLAGRGDYMNNSRDSEAAYRMQKSAARDAEQLEPQLGESLATVEAVVWLHPERLEFRDTEMPVPAYAL